MTNQNIEPDEPAADVTSDPARDDETGRDWSTEGGATDVGPATEVEADPADENAEPDDD
jgi:hypothetical protein